MVGFSVAVFFVVLLGLVVVLVGAIAVTVVGTIVPVPTVAIISFSVPGSVVPSFVSCKLLFKYKERYTVGLKSLKTIQKYC